MAAQPRNRTPTVLPATSGLPLGALGALTAQRSIDCSLRLATHDAVDAASLARLRRGDEQALGELFDRHRERLERMVRFRMDRRLAARVDADDILQEAFVNAAQRIRHLLKDFAEAPFVWLRMIVGQTLIDVHRRHLGAEKRNACREVSLEGAPYRRATSLSLAAGLLDSATSPSLAAQREEAIEHLERALATMSPLDQEIIALRHFEDLSNSEVARVLDIAPTAASNRYVRALARLQQVLALIPGFFDELPSA